MTFNVSILPLLIGTIFNMVLGALWYSNVLFSKSWMKESGVTEAAIKDTSGMTKVYFLTMLMALSTSYVIGFMVSNMGITTIIQVIVMAAIMWLGTDLPMIIKKWGFEGRTLKLGLINHSYQLLVYVVVGIFYLVF